MPSWTIRLKTSRWVLCANLLSIVVQQPELSPAGTQEGRSNEFLKKRQKADPSIVVHNPRRSESDRQGLVHDKISTAPEMSRVTGLLIMLVGAATQLARIRSPRAQESPRARARKRNPRGPSKTEVGRRGSADGSVEENVCDAPRSRRPKP